MLTATMMGLPVSLDVAMASSQVRCQVICTGFFQSSAVGAGHMASRLPGAGPPRCSGDGPGMAPPWP